jgi:putative sterol carrier protein
LTFEGAGCIFLDGKSSPNTVSDEDKDADCTMTVSLETFEAMRNGEIDGTSAFMQVN